MTILKIKKLKKFQRSLYNIDSIFFSDVLDINTMSF